MLRRATAWLNFCVLGPGLLLTLCVSAPAQTPVPNQQAKALAVERIYGQPSLSGSLTQGIQWSADGKQLSYFQPTDQTADAKTSLWALDIASGERRVLVDSDKLKQLLPRAPRVPGQQTGLGRAAPQHYSWSPKNDALLFFSEGDLLWFDLKTQTAKRLAGSHSATPAEEKSRKTGLAKITDPKISPDGNWVSFVRNYDLWIVDVVTGQETQLTTEGREELMNAQLDWVYPEELEIRTAYWWAPDSSRIAYLQMDERPVTKYPLVDYLSYAGEMETMRYPKAGGLNPVVRLGVVPASGGDTRWLDLGGDADVYIARVQWLRDSRRLAVERLNRAQNRLELLFVETGSGRLQLVLTEEDSYWINLQDDLWFLSDRQRFLWSSERDGFRHLYLYDLKGKFLNQLTSGSWEVTSLAGVDEKQGLVYFTATEKSPIERHLYRVPLEGGEMKRISKEAGTHAIHLAPNATHYLDTYSNAMMPPRQDLYDADGTHPLAINENRVAELAEYSLQPVEFLIVPGADATPLHAMLIKPANLNPMRKYPVLVNLYGGPHGQLVRNAWGGSGFLWHQMMAQKGYIIFTLDNRGMAARGHAFESAIYHKLGQTELADQLAGIAFLRMLPYVDASRIGIWGWSYGGYMTCYAMLNAADVFKAGFAGAPVTDWRQYDTIYTERYMGLPKENAEGYQRSSPVTHAGQLKGKLLIAHGTGDDNVHLANTLELAEQFIKSGRYAEYQLYPGRGHPISDSTARIHLFRRITQFFLDNL